MKKFPSALVRRSTKLQAGVAAIECALLLPILLAFLLLGFFTASIFWHYTMAQKAAQDAARYLSTVSASEMMTPASAQAAGNLAQEIIRREIAEVSPSSQIGTLETFCDNSNCGGKLPGTVPTTVRVNFSISMFDPSGLIDTGWYGLPITANYTMRYVGN
jgi:Flp pilus assembly protein TadG